MPALRFVRGPDGAVVPDLAGKLPGRGAWCAPTRSAVTLAARRGAFARSFKDQASVPGGPDAFAESIAGLLAERALSQLGLARRAGQLFAGFEAVRERGPELCAYLTPSDASGDGVAKVAAKVAATGAVPHLALPVTAEALSAAIGEVGAVHVGLARGKAGRAAMEAAALWTGYDAPASSPRTSTQAS